MSIYDISPAAQQNTQAICFDFGSHLIKAGFGGDTAPRAVFPNIIGRINQTGVMVGMQVKDKFVGDEAIAKSAVLKLQHIISKGKIKSWNDFETIFHHSVYNELRVAPEEHVCFFTEPLGIEKETKEKLIQVLFETFNVPGFCSVNSGVCSIISQNKKSGINVDVGDTMTQITAVKNECVLDYGSTRKNIGGRDITKYLAKLMKFRGYNLTTNSAVKKDLCNNIKEKMCYLSLDYKKELEKAECSAHCEKEYTLPDYEKIVLGEERFKATELLFQPKLNGFDIKGLPILVKKTLQNVSNESDVMENVVITGGTTMLEDFVNRFKGEINKETNNDFGKVKITAPLERKYSPWIGLSSISEINSWGELIISKDDYDDIGPSCWERKQKHNY